MLHHPADYPPHDPNPQECPFCALVAIREAAPPRVVRAPGCFPVHRPPSPPPAPVPALSADLQALQAFASGLLPVVVPIISGLLAEKKAERAERERQLDQSADRRDAFLARRRAIQDDARAAKRRLAHAATRLAEAARWITVGAQTTLAKDALLSALENFADCQAEVFCPAPAPLPAGIYHSDGHGNLEPVLSPQQRAANPEDDHPRTEAPACTCVVGQRPDGAYTAPELHLPGCALGEAARASMAPDQRRAMNAEAARIELIRRRKDDAKKAPRKRALRAVPPPSPPDAG